MPTSMLKKLASTPVRRKSLFSDIVYLSWIKKVNQITFLFNENIPIQADHTRWRDRQKENFCMEGIGTAESKLNELLFDGWIVPKRS